MLHGRLMWIAGIVIALILGLSLAYPLLTSEMPYRQYENFRVDVVYAYFGDTAINPNVTGLYRNYSLPDVVTINGARFGFDVHPISYLVVLNITNLASNSAYVKDLVLYVGPQINLPKEGGVSIGNGIVIDPRNRVDITGGFDPLWSAKTSRLIYLSGFIGVHDIAYSSLNSGPTYVYAKASGDSSGEKASVSGYTLKQLLLQNFNGSYLYNNLLNDNQMLVFYSDLDVYVGTRSTE